jgi:hypothetical protein
MNHTSRGTYTYIHNLVALHPSLPHFGEYRHGLAIQQSLLACKKTRYYQFYPIISFVVEDSSARGRVGACVVTQQSPPQCKTGQWTETKVQRMQAKAKDRVPPKSILIRSDIVRSLLIHQKQKQ